MKTITLFYSRFFKALFIVLFGLLTQYSFSQITENDTVKGYNKGKIKLNNPRSIVEAYTYDPNIDRYVYTKTFDGFNINYPIILTPKEYQKLVLRESMRDYFKKKSDAIDGKKEGSEAAKKNLLFKHKIFTGEAKPNVIRLLPALNITKKEADIFLEAIKTELA